MTTQVIRPAGAGHETLYVLALCLAILLLASSVVVWRAEPEQHAAVSGHQLDARRDLNAAEQGIHADLSVAVDEIHLYREEEQRLPSPQELAEDSFPPFVDNASAANRGQHRWQLLDLAGEEVYLGLSQAHDVAGSFLLRLEGPQADIWINRDAHPTPPTDLQQQALIAAGWRQVVVQFDAGVTRQHRH
ncbi:DUF6162 family protein [Pseudomonas lopnurensis]|uniref:DUF6162 family protein n=1 Tax=Pseudomonas lopnurensis TaxID=1477517 RepID=UPI00187AC2F8|nr:DUF6162 family protein [Pseudomonas lopnurensis]MBE7373894.1 hypothetical protein [Pseudomonas lopnurensis]